jgi:hypothetical protein
MGRSTRGSKTTGVVKTGLLVLSGASVFLQAQSAPSIDVAKAGAAFAEAQQISTRDNGRLWGKPLYGPMLFVEPATRATVANKPDAGGVLSKEGDVYVGKLPKDVVVANTAVEWEGKRWTMVMWPLPQNSQPRERLLAHELFHRIQPDLGIPYANPENAQLDTLEGRMWLQLEWRALAAALAENGEAQARATQDALAFAAHRHELFPGSAEAERSLIVNEGLAEYTGIAASSPDAASGRWRIITRLTSPEADTFVRSFAYASGPAYGLLLDERLPGWRSRIKPTSDLMVLLGGAVPSPAAAPVEQRALVYGEAALRIVETERDVRTQAERARYRKLLVDGLTLTVSDAGKFNYTFDPNEVVTLPGFGMVFPTSQVSDQWGTLDVQQGGALLAPDRHSLRIAAPASVAGPHVTGPGWTLDLAAGWRVVPAEKAGSFTLQKQ